ncbi:MAG: hypothetical protein ACUVWZ_06150 [Anaerolineae bacterium]
MVLTMAAVADHKGISLSRLVVSVEGRTEFVGRQASTRFVSRLDLGDGLTPREQRILFNSARQCEVHKMLRGEMAFEEYLEGLEVSAESA